MAMNMTPTRPPAPTIQGIIEPHLNALEGLTPSSTTNGSTTIAVKASANNVIPMPAIGVNHKALAPSETTQATTMSPDQRRRRSAGIASHLLAAACCDP
jgi:hypothetical protein